MRLLRSEACRSTHLPWGKVSLPFALADKGVRDGIFWISGKKGEDVVFFDAGTFSHYYAIMNARKSSPASDKTAVDILFSRDRPTSEWGFLSAVLSRTPTEVGMLSSPRFIMNNLLLLNMKSLMLTNCSDDGIYFVRGDGWQAVQQGKPGGSKNSGPDCIELTVVRSDVVLKAHIAQAHLLTQADINLLSSTLRNRE